MDSAIGWLLDVTVDGNAATLWIKTIGGSILRLVDKHQPNLYILPTDERLGTELFYTLSQQPKITSISNQQHTRSPAHLVHLNVLTSHKVEQLLLKLINLIFSSASGLIKGTNIPSPPSCLA
jgi:hypothetical protein